MSFFQPLRRINRLYPDQSTFLRDNNFVRNSSPSGFRNVFDAPSTRQIAAGRLEPGYNLGNNRFVSAADVNSILRNNDVPGIRNIFTNANTNQIAALQQMRRFDNIPDASLHSNKLRRDAVKNNFPNTNTNTPEGITTVLQQNPRLSNYMNGLKQIGKPVLLGVGIYFVFTAATLVEDIVNALNRVGGSYHVTGENGGEEYSICMLRQRTCRLHNPNDTAITFCARDPLLTNADQQEELRTICQGYNFEREKSVCRASDPSADPTTPQFVDIHDLPASQKILCIEPYNLGDLIGDLGLGNLLGEEGILNRSSGKSSNSSEKLLPIILLIGAVILIGFIIFFIIKRLMTSSENGNRNR